MSEPIVKVIVSGERDWTDDHQIEVQLRALMGLHGRHLMVLTTGHAGAEALAIKTANALNLSVHTYAPDYLNKGKPALAEANQRMINENPGITKLLVFEERTKRATLDLIRRAERAGIPWQVIRKEIVING